MKSLGWIPNDLIIRLRANHPSVQVQYMNILQNHFLHTENDFEYEFEFEKYTPFSEDIFTDSRMAVFLYYSCRNNKRD